MYVSFGPNSFDRPTYQSGAVVRRELLNLFPEPTAKVREDRRYTLLPTPGWATTGISLSNAGDEIDVLATQEGTFSNDLVVIYNDGSNNRYIDRVTTANAVTQITGDALTDSGEVSVAFSTISGSGVDSQLVFTSNGNVYFHAQSDGTYSEVTPDTNLTFETVLYIDGRFVAIPTNDDVFYWTEVLDGDNWPTTNFATAEFTGDNLVTAVTRAGELVLFGTDSIERWASTGDSELPFARIGGGIYEVGCAGPRAAINADGAIYFVSDDNEIYSLQGSNLQAISTPAQAEIIDGLTAAEKKAIKVWNYGQDGHEFIGFTLPNVTLVFDSKVGEWHERKSSSSTNAGNSVIRWNGKIVVGPSNLAEVYELSKTTYDDPQGDITRRCTVFVPANRYVSCYNFIVDGAKGTSQSATLDWSDDYSGYNSNPRSLSFGSTAGTRVFANRLGRIKPPGRIFRMTFANDALYRLDGVRINERDI